jgi:hypothetical protein
MHSIAIEYHTTLASYFVRKDLYLGEQKTKPNTRKLVEQPWQQTKAEMWDEAIETLCDLFLCKKSSLKGCRY